MKDSLTLAFTEHDWFKPPPKTTKYSRHPDVCRSQVRESMDALRERSITKAEAIPIVAELKASGSIWWGRKDAS